MRISVGDFYLTRLGAAVKIIMKTSVFDDGHDMFCPYLGSNGKRYDDRGRINHFATDGQSVDDLVETYQRAGVVVIETVRQVPVPVASTVVVVEPDVAHTVVAAVGSLAVEAFRAWRRR